MSRSAETTSRSALAVVPAGSNAPTMRLRAPCRDQQAALQLVGLAMVGRVLRNRRLYERIVVGAIVAAVLTRMGREKGLSTIARLVAWNTHEVQRLERKASRHSRGR
jgi:hypothetical protein